MISAEQIRNNLIDKLNSINNKELLIAVDKLLGASLKEGDVYEISSDQKAVLEASESDVKYDRLISDEDLNDEEDEWLKSSLDSNGKESKKRDIRLLD